MKGDGMTEYWVSQSRYYCKFCKCWMTDKKSTRENHDKGVRHKQAYREHFDKLKKEKLDQAKADDEVLAELQKIERAANQQYAEDLTKGYGVQPQVDPAQRQQYFYYGSGDEAFISAQSEEKARLTEFYQQQGAQAWPGHGDTPAELAVTATATEVSEEDEALAAAQGNQELLAIIAKKKEEKRKREEEEERKRIEDERQLEEKKKRAGPYGMWTTVDKSEIEAREEERRSLKRQKTREIEQDSSDSDVEEEDDRIVKKEEEDEPVVAVEFKKRQPAAAAGGGRRRPPLRKKLADDDD